MGKIFGRIKKNGGFTLVELMIVLSIIAILAVVLVPKVGQMKNSVKEQGVNVNMNSVRGFLELQTNARNPVAAAEITRLLAAAGPFTTTFTGSDVIKNPMTNGVLYGQWANVDDPTYSVIYYTPGGIFTGNSFTNANYTGTYTNRTGKVIVWVYNNAYVIWGHDASGNGIQYQVVR